MSAPTNLDALIQAAAKGDRKSLDQAWPGLYAQLHEIAAAQMAKERDGHLLQTTAVVHEAYVRLVQQERSNWPTRNSFFAAVATVMRRVLIDCARSEKADKRGGQFKRTDLAESRLAVDDDRFEALDVHEALERLADFSPDQARVMELIIFGGLTGYEVAEVLGVSESTIDRRVRSAKAWLRRELSER